jgi:regulatory protein
VRRASTRSKPLSSPYEAAVLYLGNRPRSVAEIRRHLRGKRYDDEAIDGAIDKLRAQRYVDDLDFAKYWVEQRSRFRPKGDRALVSELSSKGVSRETIDTALGETPAESEAARARRAIARSLARWQALDPPERKRKVHAFLVTRGFSYDVIEEVIRAEAPNA